MGDLMIKRLSFSVVHCAKDPKVDIIFIHGLGGDPRETWTGSNGVFWPAQVLPDGVNDARILTYGYNADPAFFSEEIGDNIVNHAHTLVAHLHALRNNKRHLATERPIIFVCHSLGGVVVKRALIYAAECSRTKKLEHLHGIFVSMYGILFLGTPHRESSSASWGQMLSSMCSIAMPKDAPDHDYKLVKSDTLRNITDHFKGLTNNFQIYLFWESLGTSDVNTYIVPQESAAPTEFAMERSAIEADHFGMCRFDSAHSPGYNVVEEALQRYSEQGPAVISSRWVTAKRLMTEGRLMEAFDVVRSYGYEIAERRSDAVQASQGQGRKELMQSLSFWDMANREHEVSGAVPETCLWIWDHEMFRQWETGGGLLWLKGSPGTGKSTLLKAIVQRRRDSALNDQMLVFFFHRRGSKLQRGLLGLYRSLLHQLFSKDTRLSQRLTAIFLERNENQGKFEEKWNWHENELRQHLQSAIVQKLKSSPLILFVDALDEAGEEQALLLVAFLESLIRLSRNASNKLSICFTCRRYPILTLKSGIEISVETQTEHDIKTVIETKARPWPGISQETLDKIVSLASGSFQWVILVTDSIIRQHKKGKSSLFVNRKLQDIPVELSDLYRDLLRDIDEEDRNLALLIFLWVGLADIPLSVTELRQALAFDSDLYPTVNDWEASDDFIENDDQMVHRLTALSQGLIEVQKDSRRVQFIHQSVADYMMDRGIAMLDPTPDSAIGRGYFRLCRSCIRHTVNPVPPGYEAFSKHATASLFEYAYNAETNNFIDERFLSEFKWPSEEGFKRFRTLKSKLGQTSDATLLHTLCRDGLCITLQLILEKELNGELSEPLPILDRWDRDGTTPLMLACSHGYTSSVRLLLATGRVNVNAKNNHGDTPLSKAAIRGHDSIVKLLLETGRVDVTAKNRYGNTAFSRATVGGSVSVVKLLLATDTVEIDGKNRNGNTPLSGAVDCGHEAVVKVLLATGKVDVNAKNHSGEVLLSRAVVRGHHAIVKLLLATKEINVNATFLDAIFGGRESVVKLLLASGKVELKARNRAGRGPLFFAVENGLVRMVKLLLATGEVDVDAKDNHDWTALSLAAWKGHQAVVALLLATERVDVNASIKNGWTSVFLSVEKGYTDIVKMLLATDKVDVNARDHQGWTVLSQAAWQGKEEIVKMLLEVDKLDINSKDIYGRTPLSLAVWNGHESVVQQLLESAADYDTKDKWELTPIFRAWEQNQMRIYEMLVQKGAYNRCKDKHGRPPRVSTWSEFCNGCGARFPDLLVFFHCKECNDGEYYFCGWCFYGSDCHGQGHSVGRKRIRKGKVEDVIVDRRSSELKTKHQKV